MKADRASRTAAYMAFYRALETSRGAGRAFADPLAFRFLDPGLARAARASRLAPVRAVVEWYSDRRIPGARTSAIARTWAIDRALCAALGAGAGQVVLLGAGFDCRAYRLACAASIPFFEVDHPATLRLKQERLGEAPAGSSPRVRSVAIDFNRERLPDVLAAAGLDPDRPAVFVWEGVTNYLDAAAVDDVMRYVGGCVPDTRLVFTYVHRGALEGSAAFPDAPRLLRDVSELGEPWTFGLLPEEAVDYLAARGLSLESDLSAREYRRACFGPRADRMRGYEFYHVAVARVAGER